MLHCRSRDRCRVLKLTGCTRVSGTGLEPLRGSRMLREIDLRLDTTCSVGPVELNTRFVLPLLSSMPPITAPPEMPNLPDGTLGLAMVKFRRQTEEDHYYFRFDANVAEWLRQFSGALVRHAIQRRLSCCGCCQTAIVDVTSREVLPWKLETSYCEQCKKYSCCAACTESCPFTGICSFCMMRCGQPMGPGSSTQCPTNVMIDLCSHLAKWQT